MQKIPVHIPNRNMLTPLKAMVERIAKCEAVGRITIVDCASTYPPLLEWYDSVRKDVTILFERNRGTAGAFDVLRPDSDFYVVSDSDLDLNDVPLDWLVKLREKLKRYPIAPDEGYLDKTALSLRLDDLPEGCPLTEMVRAEQGRMWTESHVDDLGTWYTACTDTTAACYNAVHGWCGYKSLRLGPPYAARHIPWYYDLTNIPEEFRYYLERINPSNSMWGRTMRRMIQPPVVPVE